MSNFAQVKLTDFTGGLNLRRSEFTLADNESPDMQNVEIDPRSGIFTRRSWERWNASDIVTTPTDVNWSPRHGYVHQLSSGLFEVFIANGTTVYGSTSSASFSDLGFTVGASPHLADFASWGDVCYIVCGKANATQSVTALTDTALSKAGNSNWNDTYTAPVGGVFPAADLVETHLGYAFVASVNEDYDGGGAANYPNRIRWSHPNEPEDWAQLDFIDISEGGGRITALKSFQDHLLIFKESSIWALYGYDASSWQLIQISRSAGCSSPSAVTRARNAIYFYSPSSTSGVYGYGGGEVVHVSDSLQEAMESITDHDDAWLGWVGRRLWCCLPWDPDSSENGASVFVFDPEVGNGVWARHTPALGELRCIMEGSDVVNDYPLAVIEGSSGAAAVLELGVDDGVATDSILEDETTSPFDAYYRTGWKYAGEEELRKSWLRPRFIMGRPPLAVDVAVDSYWDYDESSPRRQQIIALQAGSNSVWDALGSGGAGFDWGDGTLWSGVSAGSQIKRTYTGLPIAKWAAAVSLRFSTGLDTPGVPWSVSGAVLKYRNMERTT